MMRFSNCSAALFAGAATFAHGLTISNEAVMTFEAYQNMEMAIVFKIATFFGRD